MIKLANKKNIALVLSGGGIKAAAFHVGVCLALKEKGFRFVGGTQQTVPTMESNNLAIRMYVGSSAGAVISTFLASGYDIESVIDAFQMGSSLRQRYFKRTPTDASVDRQGRLKPLSYFHIFSLNKGNFTRFIPKIWTDKSFYSGGLEALIKSGFKINGLFTTHGLERYLRKYVLPQNQFSALGVPLFIIGTQLNHSRKVVFGNFKDTYKVKTIKYANFSTISEAVAASASLPPFFAPYGIKNQKGKELYFFDGEIRDTLSTHVAADHGADLVISSYSVQPYHYTPELGSLHHYGIPMIINQALYQVIEQKIEKHRKYQKDLESIYRTVDGYFRQSDLPDEHRQKLLNIIAERVNFKPDVDYLYIHPSPQDHEMFFVDHFSLKPQILEKIVKIGFRSAINVLRKHDV